MFGEKEWSEKDDEAKAQVLAPRPQELHRSAVRRVESLFNAPAEEGAAAEETAVAEEGAPAEE